MPLATGNVAILRSEAWAKSMGTGYPSAVGPNSQHKYVEHRTYTSHGCAMCGLPESQHLSAERPGLVDQIHQNPSGQPEGQEVEAAGTGDAEAGEHEQHEAKD